MPGPRGKGRAGHMDRLILFNILYALMASEGREAVLFGQSAPAMNAAFSRSLGVPSAFPEVWFEIPLLGDPWCDVHALTSIDDARQGLTLGEGVRGASRDAFTWFAQQGDSVRQLALSWDTGSGNADVPAIQLLMRKNDVPVTCDFLSAVGRSDAVDAYRSFARSLPDEWFACYAGVFPERPGHNLRVECVPSHDMQRAYAEDAALLGRHLRQVGPSWVDDSLVALCQELAVLPFQLEFQFDVDARGRAEGALSASVRFACPPGEPGYESFGMDGAAAELMTKLQDRGLVDGRWQALADVAFAKRIARGDSSVVLSTYTAFVKLRWRDGALLDAKAYVIGGAQ